MYFCARFLKTDMAQFTEEDKIMRRVEQRFNKGMVILVNLRASFVRGIGGRLFSQLLKSMDVLR